MQTKTYREIDVKAQSASDALTTAERELAAEGFEVTDSTVIQIGDVWAVEAWGYEHGTDADLWFDDEEIRDDLRSAGAYEQAATYHIGD